LEEVSFSVNKIKAKNFHENFVSFIDWRYDPDHPSYDDNMHRKIIKWFGDSSSKSSPFSIHALVHLGEELGKKPGDWYGPSSVSHLLK